MFYCFFFHLDFCALTHAVHLYRIVKRCVVQAEARLARNLTCSIKFSASGNYSVILFDVRIAISMSHGCQAAITCVVGTGGMGSAMTVASH